MDVRQRLPLVADSGFQRCSMLGVETRPRLLELLGLVELVRVDPERDPRVCVPELPGDEDDVLALGEQHRPEPVAEQPADPPA